MTVTMIQLRTGKPACLWPVENYARSVKETESGAENSSNTKENTLK